MRGEQTHLEKQKNAACLRSHTHTQDRLEGWVGKQVDRAFDQRIMCVCHSV